MGTRLLTVSAQITLMCAVFAAALLFVVIGFLVLLHVCIVVRALIAVHRAERCTERKGRLSRDELEKLPCFDYLERSGGGDHMSSSSSSLSSDCAVCLESFQSGARCRLLPVCRHSFHAQCVDLWLLNSPVCPVCRAAVVS